MRIIFVRQQDYWVFPLSFLGVFLFGFFLYAGLFWMGLMAGLAGIALLYFVTYSIRRNYSQRLAIRYLTICLLSAALGALGAYLLTN